MPKKTVAWKMFVAPERLRPLRLCGLVISGIPLRCRSWLCTRCRLDAVRAWHAEDEATFANCARVRAVEVVFDVPDTADVPAAIRREKLRLHALVRRHRRDRILVRGAVDPTPLGLSAWRVTLRFALGLGSIAEERIIRNLRRLWPSLSISVATGVSTATYWPAVDPAGVFPISGIGERDPCAIGALMSLLKGRRLMRIKCGQSGRTKPPVRSVANVELPYLEPMPVLV